MKILIKMAFTFLLLLCFTICPVYSTQASSPNNNFRAVLYTGNGGAQSISGLGFKPDFVWVKLRDDNGGHRLFNSVEGATKYLDSSTSNAVITDTASLLSYDADGFALGASPAINWSDHLYVAWCWSAGGAATSNGLGTIPSTTMANPENGFSIVKYTGNGSSAPSVTVGHGLSKEPEIIIEKGLDSAFYWTVQAGWAWGDWTKTLFFSSNTAVNPASGRAAPTNTVFSPSVLKYANESGKEYIAYCFHSVPGVSKVGAYTGEEDHEEVLGFSPAFLMIKRTDDSGNWVLYDNQRETQNPRTKFLQADNFSPESTSFLNTVEFTSTGFKLLDSGGNTNATGGNYIYLAFALKEALQINFSADKTSIDHAIKPEESVTLSWDIQSVETLSVSLKDQAGTEYTIENQGATGSHVVIPKAPTSYILTVAVGGREFAKQVHVDVVNGFDKGGVFAVDGKIGVGVLKPTQAFEVDGTIKAKEVVVTSEGWADYVFSNDYQLRDLATTEQFIRENRHLPGIPSESELKSKGIPISRMLELQMEKIEELTLHVIQQNKEIIKLKEKLRD